MIKPFYFTATLLFLIIVAISTHYILAERKEISGKINAVAGMTGVTSPSLSVAYYERRLLIGTDGRGERGNIAFPEMMPIERMDYVYAE